MAVVPPVEILHSVHAPVSTARLHTVLLNGVQVGPVGDNAYQDRIQIFCNRQCPNKSFGQLVRRIYKEKCDLTCRWSPARSCPWRGGRWSGGWRSPGPRSSSARLVSSQDSVLDITLGRTGGRGGAEREDKATNQLISLCLVSPHRYQAFNNSVTPAEPAAAGRQNSLLMRYQANSRGSRGFTPNTF